MSDTMCSSPSGYSLRNRNNLKKSVVALESECSAIVSFCERQEITRPRSQAATTGDACWSCFKTDKRNMIRCSLCPRLHHPECSSASPNSLICPECSLRNDAQIPEATLKTHLLKVLTEMKNLRNTSSVFQYTRCMRKLKYATIVNFETLAAKIAAGAYTSYKMFCADVRWMYYNAATSKNCVKSHIATSRRLCILSSKHSEFSLAEPEEEEHVNAAVGDAIPQNFETETEAVGTDCAGPSTAVVLWTEPAPKRKRPSEGIEETTLFNEPHLLVWAKLPNFNYCPAKVMGIKAEREFLVEFFGTKTKCHLLPTCCFLLTDDPPSSKDPRAARMDEALAELTDHIAGLRIKYGDFQYAESVRPQIDSLTESISAMLPNWEAPAEVEVEAAFIRKRYRLSEVTKTEASPIVDAAPAVTISEVEENESLNEEDQIMTAYVADKPLPLPDIQLEPVTNRVLSKARSLDRLKIEPRRFDCLNKLYENVHNTVQTHCDTMASQLNAIVTDALDEAEGQQSEEMAVALRAERISRPVHEHLQCLVCQKEGQFSCGWRILFCSHECESNWWLAHKEETPELMHLATRRKETPSVDPNHRERPCFLVNF